VTDRISRRWVGAFGKHLEPNLAVRSRMLVVIPGKNDEIISPKSPTQREDYGEDAYRRPFMFL
jgi:hypothetical protein